MKLNRCTRGYKLIKQRIRKYIQRGCLRNRSSRLITPILINILMLNMITDRPSTSSNGTSPSQISTHFPKTHEEQPTSMTSATSSLSATSRKSKRKDPTHRNQNQKRKAWSKTMKYDSTSRNWRVKKLWVYRGSRINKEWMLRSIKNLRNKRKSCRRRSKGCSSIPLLRCLISMSIRKWRINIELERRYLQSI